MLIWLGALKPLIKANYLTDKGKGIPLSQSWLGDLDSNQGCPGQSREFYR